MIVSCVSGEAPKRVRREFRRKIEGWFTAADYRVTPCETPSSAPETAGMAQASERIRLQVDLALTCRPANDAPNVHICRSRADLEVRSAGSDQLMTSGSVGGVTTRQAHYLKDFAIRRSTGDLAGDVRDKLTESFHLSSE